MRALAALAAAAVAVLLASLQPSPGGEGEEFRRKLQVAVDRSPPGDRPLKATLLFLHGWPDNGRVWQKQVDFFVAEGYRCVAAELPNHGEHGEKTTWGFDFDVLASQLNNLARELRQTAPSDEGKRVVLIGHDWGGWIGYMAQRTAPELYDGFVPMDVAPGNGPLPLDVQWRVGAYQLANLAAFLIGLVPQVGPPVGDWLLQAAVTYAIGPLTAWAPSGAPLTPTPVLEMRASMGWTYWHTWKPPYFLQWALWRTQGLQGWCDCSRDAELRGELPSCPTLFMYGSLPEYRLPLAGKHFIELMQRSSDGVARHVKRFPSHHWFFYHLADDVNAEMLAFLHKIGL